MPYKNISLIYRDIYFYREHQSNSYKTIKKDEKIKSIKEKYNKKIISAITVEKKEDVIKYKNFVIYLLFEKLFLILNSKKLY